MKNKMLVSTMVVFLVGCALGAPDLVTQQSISDSASSPVDTSTASSPQAMHGSAMPAWIQAFCSLITLVLAVVVFIVSRKHEVESRGLIDELRIAIVMGTTEYKDAHAAKKIYDDYKGEFQRCHIQ